MEQILTSVLNQAWGLIAGSLVTVFVGGVALWLYINIGAQKLVKEQPRIIVNRIAVLVRKYLLIFFKDRNFTDQVLKDLDCSGNEFDFYWDEGLRGIIK